jgi:RNA-directed DNA polymerase
MKEPHGEGPATHTGPESCATAREGRGEALDRGTSRQGIEPRKVTPGADVVRVDGRQHPWRRYRETPWGPARSETPRMLGNSRHGNREISDSSRKIPFETASGSPKDVRR